MIRLSQYTTLILTTLLGTGAVLGVKANDWAFVIFCGFLLAGYGIDRIVSAIQDQELLISVKMKGKEEPEIIKSSNHIINE